MRNDGVDIEPCNDEVSNGFQVGFIDDKEWLMYTLDVNSKTTFDVAIRYSSESAEGKLHFENERGKISKTIAIPFSGGKDNWKTITLKGVVLNKGINKVKVYFEKGNFNLNYLEFKKH
jgi:hypothetical protein